jgi:hypothetical protein
VSSEEEEMEIIVGPMLLWRCNSPLFERWEVFLVITKKGKAIEKLLEQVKRAICPNMIGLWGIRDHIEDLLKIL